MQLESTDTMGLNILKSTQYKKLAPNTLQFTY